MYYALFIYNCINQRIGPLPGLGRRSTEEEVPLHRNLPAFLAAAFSVALTAAWASAPALAQKSKDTLRFPVFDPDSGIDK